MKSIVLLLAIVLGSGYLASAQPPARPLFRCEVPTIISTGPEAAIATMTVVSDGLACNLMNWGVPTEGRNPATAGEVTVPPQHGMAVFLRPAVRYIADRDYTGPDSFTYRSTAVDVGGVSRTVTVRVTIDVRAAPFDRISGPGTRTASMMPALPLRAGNDIPVPRKTKDVKPEYPSDAMLARVEGQVELDVTVEADGSVSTARAVRSIPMLDAAAIAAVRQWRFEPTSINGRAVPVTIMVPINFRLPPEAVSPSVPAAAVPDDIQPIRIAPGMPGPKVLKQVKPTYTPEAIKAHVGGAVGAELTVDAQGKVTDVKIVRSLPMLDDAAIAAARQWEFTPTILNGRPVPVIVNIELTFAVRTEQPAADPPASGNGAVPSPLAGAPSVDTDIRDAFQMLEKRQYTEALKAFKDANDRRGQACASCYVGLARAYESLGAAKNVVEACDKALTLAGEDRLVAVMAHQLKALALQDLGLNKDPKRLHDAEQELRAALAIDRSASFLHYNLGVVLLREGRDANGIAELKEELALRPDSPYAERSRKMIENPRRAREAFAPDFSIVTLDREFMDVSSLRGKVVLLDFWGTWCAPCVSAVPTLRGLQKHFKDENFVLISVSSDSDEAAVRRFTEANQMTWPQYWDRDRKVQQAFEIRAYPTYVLIDADGVVQFRTTGGGTIEPVGLENAIKTHLKRLSNAR